MLLSLYNALIIPFDISFGVPFSLMQFNSFADLVLDVVFLIDNILMFFTSYFNQFGIEVKNPYKIYKNYTSTWRFVFDTLSLLGSFFFIKIHPYFKYF